MANPAQKMPKETSPPVARTG